MIANIRQNLGYRLLFLSFRLLKVGYVRMSEPDENDFISAMLIADSEADCNTFCREVVEELDESTVDNH